MAACFDIFRIVSNRDPYCFKISIDLINNTILAFLTILVTDYFQRLKAPLGRAGPQEANVAHLFATLMLRNGSPSPCEH